MFKRVVAAVLWFLFGVNAWAFVVTMTGVPVSLGLVFGVLLATAALAGTRTVTRSPIELQLSK